MCVCVCVCVCVVSVRERERERERERGGGYLRCVLCSGLNQKDFFASVSIFLFAMMMVTL